MKTERKIPLQKNNQENFCDIFKRQNRKNLMKNSKILKMISWNRQAKYQQTKKSNELAEFQRFKRIMQR